MDFWRSGPKPGGPRSPRRGVSDTVAEMNARHAALAALLVVNAAAIACGGSKPPATPPTPGGAAGATPTAAAASGEPDPTGGTTTTTAVGSSGDLQGAKLETAGSSSAHSETHGPKSDGKAEPGRGRDDIRTIVMARRDQARACYDAALKDHPGIEGDLDIKWTIDPKGDVTDISVDAMKSQINEPSVGNCIIEIIKKIKFNESKKGFETRTHYPFNFHPKNQTAKPRQ